MSTGIIKITVTLLLSVFILSNCTMQERRYRKGFYVSVKDKMHNKNEKYKKEDALAVIDLKVKAEEEVGCKQELVASIVKTTPPIPKLRPTKIKGAISDTCGDFIIMKDGAVVEGKITEISETEVKYKRCNNLSGPSYTTKLEKVLRIKFANGKEEDFGKIVNQEKSTNSVSSKKKIKEGRNPFAIASLILGIFSFTIIFAFLTAPLAFIFGLIAEKQLNEGRGNKGYRMAKFGKTVGLIFTIILLFLLILLILTSL